MRDSFRSSDSHASLSAVPTVTPPPNVVVIVDGDHTLVDEEMIQTWTANMRVVTSIEEGPSVNLCIYVCIRHGYMDGSKSIISVDDERQIEIFERMDSLGVLRAEHVVVIDLSCRNVERQYSVGRNDVPEKVRAYLVPTASGASVHPMDVIRNMNRNDDTLANVLDAPGNDMYYTAALGVLAQGMDYEDQESYETIVGVRRSMLQQPISPIVYSRAITDELETGGVKYKPFNTSNASSVNTGVMS